MDTNTVQRDELFKILKSEFIELLKTRLSHDGCAWYTDADLDRISGLLNTERKALGGFFKCIEDRLGCKYQFLSNPDVYLTIFTLLKANNGEWNEETGRMLVAEHPQLHPKGISGLVARSRRILGYDTSEEKPTPVADPIGGMLEAKMRDPAILLHQHEKLVAKRRSLIEQRDSLDEQIKTVDYEIAVYSPLISAINQLNQATNRVTTEIESRVSRSRFGA